MAFCKTNTEGKIQNGGRVINGLSSSLAHVVACMEKGHGTFKLSESLVWAGEVAQWVKVFAMQV